MAMVPLDPAAVWHVRSWLGPAEGPGLLALQHALAYRLPGLWGAPAASPRSVLLVREGSGQVEAFGAGEPEPSVGWLLRSRRAFVLHAPDAWHEAVRGRLGKVDVVRVETWAGPGVSLPMAPPSPRPRPKPRPSPPFGGGPAAGGRAAAGTGTGPGTGVEARPGARAGAAVRRLAAGDAAAFERSTPAWALRGWRKFPALIEHGAAFGVPHGSGFASVAWVFDRADNFESVAVSTAPRYQRLGLGRAASAALMTYLVRDRGQVPLWPTTPDNEASRALATSLGLSVAAVEPLLRWPPRTRDGDEDEPDTDGG